MRMKFNNECPKCKSERLEYGGIEPEEEQMRQDVHCLECDTRFSIWSVLDWECGDKNGLYP